MRIRRSRVSTRYSTELETDDENDIEDRSPFSVPELDAPFLESVPQSNVAGSWDLLDQMRIVVRRIRR